MNVGTAGTMPAILCALALAPARLPAQQPTPEPPGGRAKAEWFPSASVVEPPIAAPREVRLRGGFFSAERDRENDYSGRRLEAEVAIGYRLPLVRLRDDGDGGAAVDLGFEVGVWSRFDMENSTKDLIGVDYRVGIPLGVRAGAFEGRLELFHMSSHLGDDYLARFPQDAFQTSREALQIMAAWRPVAAARLYGGGDWNAGRSHDYVELPGGGFHTFDTVESWVLWGGAEWDASRTTNGPVAPFAGAHFETNDLTDRLAATVRAGLAFRVAPARILLDAEWRDGPSALGQFRNTDESMLGINLELQIGPMVPARPARRG